MCPNRRRGEGGHIRQNLDLELAQAHVKHLEQSRLAGVEDVALLADDVGLALAVLVAEDDAAFDHARGDAEPAQLRLQGVLEGDVVLGGDLAGGGVDDARGDAEGAGRGDAGARKVDEREAVKVGQDGLGGAVGEDEADVARQQPREALDAGCDGILGSLTQRLGHELGLAKEESKKVGRMLALSWVLVLSCAAMAARESERSEGRAYLLSDSSRRTFFR